MSKRKPEKELWVEMFKKTEKMTKRVHEKELLVEMFKKTEKALSAKCRRCGDIQSTSLSRETRQDESLRKNCRECLKKFLDTVLIELPVRCKFAKYGCEEILMKDELKNHETDNCCQYYEVNCPQSYCN